MTDPQRLVSWRIALAAMMLALATAACQSDASPSPTVPMASFDPIPAESAVSAVESLDGEFDCAEPIPRADDYAWICEGSRSEVTATIHLYATDVSGPLFGATLYTSAPPETETSAAAEITGALATELVQLAVPEAWRSAAEAWISERLPDGGRTLDVPGAGITASVQPLAASQWYLELYELDGLEG